MKRENKLKIDMNISYSRNSRYKYNKLKQEIKTHRRVKHTK